MFAEISPQLQSLPALFVGFSNPGASAVATRNDIVAYGVFVEHIVVHQPRAMMPWPKHVGMVAENSLIQVYVRDVICHILFTVHHLIHRKWKL